MASVCPEINKKKKKTMLTKLSAEHLIKIIYPVTNLRLCSSNSSLKVSPGVVSRCSEMPCDSSAPELGVRTGAAGELVLELTSVLNENCGPIHRRRLGPSCVIISTSDIQSEHSSSRKPWSNERLSLEAFLVKPSSNRFASSIEHKHNHTYTAADK